MLLTDHSIVPCIMFHSVGLPDDRYWPTVNISEPVENFRRKMEILKKVGYEFMHWDELYAYIESGPPRSTPAIMLTFDDGYLDNWTYVFPILKELAIKATFFVNPEFVDPRPDLRANYDDVLAGRISQSELQVAGFLSWSEMRAMEASGLVDIQSHTMSHTWYFKSSKLVDFHNPSEKRYPWLAWNYAPAQKPYYKSSDQSLLVPWGTPIYENERSLICRRYFPPEAVLTEITDYVERQGRENFFRNVNWRRMLREQHTILMDRYELHGRYETCDEYEKRVARELTESKEIIDKELNKSVDYICWPGGGYNESVISIARKLGFKAWTLASRDQSTLRNRPGVDPKQIKRIGSSGKYLTRQGLDCGYAGQYFFLSNIARHKGSVFAKWFSRLLRVIAILKARTAWHFRKQLKTI